MLDIYGSLEPWVATDLVTWVRLNAATLFDRPLCVCEEEQVEREVDVGRPCRPDPYGRTDAMAAPQVVVASPRPPRSPPPPPAVLWSPRSRPPRGRGMTTMIPVAVPLATSSPWSPPTEQFAFDDEDADFVMC